MSSLVYWKEDGNLEENISFSEHYQMETVRTCPVYP